MQYKETLTKGIQTLEASGIAEASLDARLLLEAVCDTDRNTLFLHPDLEVADEQQRVYEEYIARRALRIPLQQILETTNFMGLDFYVNQNVLCPRQDTEVLVEEIMPHLHDGMRVLDVCTGSGCILLSLMHYSNDCVGCGIDLSEAALEVARRNADTLFDNSDKRDSIFFGQGDLFEGLRNLPADFEQFEIMVSNPPYIATAVIETLEPEVKDHEPMMALDGTEDGLFFYRKIIAEAPAHLCHGGMLFFEIGHDQGVAVSSMMEEAGFMEVTVKKDYAGLDRVVFGTYI